MNEKINPLVQATIINDNARQTLGRKIRILREINGLTQAELAEKLGYSSDKYISAIEGGSKSMKKEKVLEAAEIQHVHPIALLSPLPLTDKQLRGMVNFWRLIEYGYDGHYIDSVNALLEAAVNETGLLEKE